MTLKSRFAILVVGMIFSLSLLGASQVWVSNYNNVGPKKAPFYDDDGTLLSGDKYVAQLYAGARSNELFAVGPMFPFLTGSNAGFFAGGVVQIPQGIVDYPCGPAWVQIRAWEVAGGGTFEAAALTRHWTGVSSLMYLEATGGCAGGVPTPAVGLIGITFPGEPLILRQPFDRRTYSSSPIHASVVPAGLGPFAYQWFFGASGDTRVPIPGATNYSVLVDSIATNQLVWVRVISPSGTVDSGAARWGLSPVTFGTLTSSLVDGLPRLTILGSAGNVGEVQLQFSPVLSPAKWVAITNLWQSSVPATYSEQEGAAFGTGFYRLSVP